ncbi:MAG: hypothetical protein DRH12_00595 [Deltaproteobacteria bacterium]|nr:MAG: hypothetical protein DRH12_00595 [Deltaproteobacteria bacterium]RLB74710.1 MAG: hypothetical protein DRH15_15175 [Deltaproteobacteria bacterium]
MKKAMAMVLVVGLMAICLGVCADVAGQPRGKGFPLSEEEMQPYEEIPFEVDNFAKIEKGMSQKQVLELLGKPIKITKEHRRRNRWTVHYFYPDGYVVNFKNGLVVGKEQKETSD